MYMERGMALFFPQKQEYFTYGIYFSLNSLLCLCTSKLRSVVAGCGQRHTLAVKQHVRVSMASVPFTFMHESLIRSHAHIPNQCKMVLHRQLPFTWFSIAYTWWPGPWRDLFTPALSDNYYYYYRENVVELTH